MHTLSKNFLFSILAILIVYSCKKDDDPSPLATDYILDGGYIHLINYRDGNETIFINKAECSDLDNATIRVNGDSLRLFGNNHLYFQSYKIPLFGNLYYYIGESRDGEVNYSVKNDSIEVTQA